MILISSLILKGWPSGLVWHRDALERGGPGDMKEREQTTLHTKQMGSKGLGDHHSVNRGVQSSGFPGPQ